jgi:hypothetical protein
VASNAILRYLAYALKCFAALFSLIDGHLEMDVIFTTARDAVMQYGLQMMMGMQVVWTGSGGTISKGGRLATARSR